MTLYQTVWLCFADALLGTVHFLRPYLTWTDNRMCISQVVFEEPIFLFIHLFEQGQCTLINMSVDVPGLAKRLFFI